MEEDVSAVLAHILDTIVEGERVPDAERERTPSIKHRKPQPHVEPRVESVRTEWEPTAADVQFLVGALEEAKTTLTDARLTDLQTSIELERENSHLYLSEMLISAVEQMKWRSVLASQALLHPALPRRFAHSRNASLVSQGASSVEDYPISEVSLSRMGSPAPSITSSVATDAPSTSSMSTMSPRAHLHRHQTRYSGQSGSGTGSEMTSRLSGESDPRTDLFDSSDFENSAEVVAQQLLANIAQLSARRSIGSQHFLVPFAHAPQELLPLPKDNEFSHGHDDSVKARSDHPTLRGEWFSVGERGQESWVPPKPAIISSRHPEPRVRRDTERQGNRCAGCGRAFYLKRVRYCDYLGKWFCLVCHVGATAQIPARVLHNWDFRAYPVCDMTLKFLGNNWAAPLFDIAALSPELYSKVKILRVIKLKRRHLRIMWDYVRTCRIASSVVTKDGLIWDMFMSLPVHFLESEDIYSMKDLCLVRDGTVEKLLDRPLHYGRIHILACQFCRAKGFHCLLCVEGNGVLKGRRNGAEGEEPELLFPFQSEKVSRCRDCGSVYHTVCWKTAKRNGTSECPYCQRRRIRRLSFVPEAEVRDRERAGSVREATEEGQDAVATT